MTEVMVALPVVSFWISMSMVTSIQPVRATVSAIAPAILPKRLKFMGFASAIPRGRAPRCLLPAIYGEAPEARKRGRGVSGGLLNGA